MNKLIRNFYKSENKLHSDGYMPICKQCLKESCYDEAKDDVDIEKLKSLLRQIDRPFLPDLWASSVREFESLPLAKKMLPQARMEIIGNYFKNLS